MDEKEENKGSAIPVRFTQEEIDALKKLKKATGMSQSELIRRCFRLMVRETKRRKDTNFIAGLASLEDDAPEKGT